MSDTLPFTYVFFIHHYLNHLPTATFYSPVLTKPDLIDKGGERAVKDLLLGSKTQSFDCGFHMVKGNFVYTLAFYAIRSITRSL